MAVPLPSKFAGKGSLRLNVISAWLCFWLVVAASILIGSQIKFDHNEFICLGASFGNIAVAAAWLALGVGDWRLRLVKSLLLCMLGFAAFSIASLMLDSWPSLDIVAIAMTGQWVLVQFPLWLLRRRYRLRITAALQSSAVPDLRLQFSLRQLMLTTTLIAVALGIGRAIVAPLGMLLPAFHTGDAIGFTLFVGFNLLLIWPAVWSWLSPGRIIWRVVLVAVSAFVVTLVEAPVFTALMPGGRIDYAIFISANIPQWLGIAALLGAMRGAGYRLVVQDPESVAGVS